MRKRLHRLLAMVLLLASGLATNSQLLPLADCFFIDKKECEEVLEAERELETEKLTSSKSGRKISLGGPDADLGHIEELLVLPSIGLSLDESLPTRAHTQLSSHLYIRFHNLKLDC